MLFKNLINLASPLLKSSSSILYSLSSIFCFSPTMHENKKFSSSFILNSFLHSLSINFNESPRFFSLPSPLTESKIESPKYSL